MFSNVWFGPAAGTAIWRAVRAMPDDWIVDSGWVSYGTPGQASIVVTTLGNGMLAWQAFAPWPAERLHEIGGGRRAYIHDSGSKASDAEGRSPPPSPSSLGAQRLARALAALDSFPEEVKQLMSTTDPLAVTEHGQFAREADQCTVGVHAWTPGASPTKAMRPADCSAPCHAADLHARARRSHRRCGAFDDANAGSGVQSGAGGCRGAGPRNRHDNGDSRPTCGGPLLHKELFTPTGSIPCTLQAHTAPRHRHLQSINAFATRRLPSCRRPRCR